MRLIEDQNIFSLHHQHQLEQFLFNKNFLDNGIFFTLRHKKRRLVSPSHFQDLKDCYGRSVFGYSPDKPIYEYFTDSALYKNWRHFLSRLNSKVLKSAYRQKRKSLPHISVEHKHPTNHYLNHIHTIIVKPATLSLCDFTKHVIDSWNSTHWGTTGNKTHDMFALKQVYSGGVIKYQFKDQQFTDSYSLGCNLSI